MVFSVRPEIAPATATLPVPAPGAGVQGTLEAEGRVVPYSSLHSVTSEPLGLTTPLSVALFAVTELAGSVLTVGLTGELGFCREQALVLERVARGRVFVAGPDANRTSDLLGGRAVGRTEQPSRWFRCAF